MASNAQRLRTQSLFDGYDQLTPGAGGSPSQYNDDPFMNPSPQQPTGLDAVANQQASDETILDPTGQPLQQNAPVEPVRPSNQYQAPPLNETIDAINKGYTPEFRSRDRFDAHLDNAPEREEPSWGRRLVAGGIGLGSKNPIEDMEKVLQAPYLREQADWTAKNDPYYKSAELENRANINERTLVSNAVTSDAANRRLMEQQRNNDAKNEIAQTRNRILQARAGDVQVKLDGNQWVGFTKDGRRIPLGSSTGMTVEEIENLKGEWRVEASRQAGADAMNRTIAAGGQYYTDADGNVQRGNPRDANAPPPVQGSSKIGTEREAPPLKAKEIEEQKQATWSEIYDTAPADERRWLKRSADGKTLILRDPPTKGSWLQSDAADEKDIEAYNRIKAKLYPETKGLGPSTTAPVPEAKKSTIGPTAPPKAQAKPPIGERSDMPGTPKNAWVQNMPGDPKKFRRSIDGGKTWQISNDGGKTWSK